MEQSNNNSIKIVIIGDIMIGKSSIARRYWSDQFSAEYQSTIGAEFYGKKVDIGDEPTTLDIWVTSGQVRFHSLLAGVI